MLPRKHQIAQINSRLYNQQIIQTSFDSAKQMVSWFGAVQSQEYGMAKWSLGLRIPGSCDADIEKAFNEGKILRTHVLRPTWHFVTPEDIGWMLELTAPRVHALNATYYKKFELNKKILNKSKDVLIKHLQGGNFLERTQLQAILKVEGLRLVLLLMHAELERIICSGPRKGKQFTYALLNERAPGYKLFPREEALYHLAQRYFASRSPATVHDFAWWSGLTVKDAKDAAGMLSSNYIHDKQLTNKERELATFLMPQYDEYSIAYTDRSAQNIPSGYNRAVIVDGMAAGTWRPVIKSKSVEIETDFFVPLKKVQQQFVRKAIQRYQSFFS